MFFNAAYASATTAVFRGPLTEPVGLDLAGPNRNFPIAFNDDPGAPRTSLEDLSVSDVALPASLLPPPIGSPSAEQGSFRKEARCTLQSLSAPSAAPGTARTHEATLRAIAPKASAKLNSCGLLMESEGVFYALSTAA